MSMRWNELSREQVEKIRARYTGKRIRLISMTDPWTALPSGLMGTCEGVDDMGQLLMLDYQLKKEGHKCKLELLQQVNALW